MNENVPVNNASDGITNDERRGLNEDAKIENAKNNYQNEESLQNNAVPPADRNEVDEDISTLEHGHQSKPGSSGAFPVGAFDTSKE